jgi:N utilization substance protein B
MGLLNRRHLRIKVLQALYAYHQSDNSTPSKGEKELFHSIDKIYELYFRMLAIYGELRSTALMRMEENRNKHLPSPEDLNPNQRFVDNAVLKLLESSKTIGAYSKLYKINWATEDVMLRKLYTLITQTEEYAEYMAKETSTFAEDKEFLMKIFRKYIANYPTVHEILDEQSIYWMDDLDLVCVMALKTIRDIKETDDELFDVLPLYKDEEDDKEFIKILFRSAIKYQDEHGPLIDAKAGNWELERIALMDRLIMNLALAEAREFSHIPLKVSLNEYIEISKFYSTPKSNGFINGILDKLFAELKEQGAIHKSGRGLIE